MTDAIAHRGPDAEGTVERSAGVFLGHRRLSIVDLAGGAQPMWTRDGQVGVVFNGEIYNHAELRAELKARGCVFETDHSRYRGAAARLPRVGRQLRRAAERHVGLRALDRKRRRLFGSRDRFGKKPLYYFHEGGTFGFRERTARLLEHPACPRILSPLSLQEVLRLRLRPGAALDLRARLEAARRALVFATISPRASCASGATGSFVLEPDERLAHEGLEPLRGGNPRHARARRRSAGSCPMCRSASS